MNQTTNSGTGPTVWLYWLREQACDAGTEMTVEELEPAVRDRVRALIAESVREEKVWMVRLPFLDRREWRSRDEILRNMPVERMGNLIRCVLDPAQATRDTAATYVLMDPAWTEAPLPNQGIYYDTWHPVSTELQKELKLAIGRAFFADIDRLEDRQMAYPVIAYQASRIFHGQSRSELTYDLRDYPECTATMAQALRMTGRATQSVLAGIEQSLLEAGRAELSRRYAPMWFEDVLVAAKKRPRQLVELLAAETTVINAVIDLGADRSVPNINRCARTINQTLRNVLGVDMRHIGADILDTATRVLARVAAERKTDVAQAGTHENRPRDAARSPHGRVGR